MAGVLLGLGAARYRRRRWAAACRRAVPGPGDLAGGHEAGAGILAARPTGGFSPSPRCGGGRRRHLHGLPLPPGVPARGPGAGGRLSARCRAAERPMVVAVSVNPWEDTPPRRARSERFGLAASAGAGCWARRRSSNRSGTSTGSRSGGRPATSNTPTRSTWSTAVVSSARDGLSVPADLGQQRPEDAGRRRRNVMGAPKVFPARFGHSTGGIRVSVLQWADAAVASRSPDDRRVGRALQRAPDPGRRRPAHRLQRPVPLHGRRRRRAVGRP